MARRPTACRPTVGCVELTLDERSETYAGAARSKTPWRASDKGLLPIEFDDYLELLDCAAASYGKGSGCHPGTPGIDSRPAGNQPGPLDRPGDEVRHLLQPRCGPSGPGGRACQAGRPQMVPRPRPLCRGVWLMSIGMESASGDGAVASRITDLFVPIGDFPARSGRISARSLIRTLPQRRPRPHSPP